VTLNAFIADLLLAARLLGRNRADADLLLLDSIYYIVGDAVYAQKLLIHTIGGWNQTSYHEDM
jgi:hypothetical protein